MARESGSGLITGIAIAVGGYLALDYFGLVPSLSSLFSSVKGATETVLGGGNKPDSGTQTVNQNQNVASPAPFGNMGRMGSEQYRTLSKAAGVTSGLSIDEWDYYYNNVFGGNVSFELIQAANPGVDRAQKYGINQYLAMVAAAGSGNSSSPSVPAKGGHRGLGQIFDVGPYATVMPIQYGKGRFILAQGVPISSLLYSASAKPYFQKGTMRLTGIEAKGGVKYLN